MSAQPESRSLGQAMVVTADRALRSVEALREQARIVDEYLLGVEAQLAGVPAQLPQLTVLNDHQQTIRLKLEMPVQGELVVTVGTRVMEGASVELRVGESFTWPEREEEQ